MVFAELLDNRDGREQIRWGGGQAPHRPGWQLVNFPMMSPRRIASFDQPRSILGLGDCGGTSRYPMALFLEVFCSEAVFGGRDAAHLPV
jgi:hypothetical protein